MRKTAISTLVFLAACSTAPAPTPAPVATKAPAYIGTNGFDVSGVDRTVQPCDDFYRFAVGKWRENNPLTPQYARFGRFEELADRNRAKLREIVESDKGKVGDFYAACMNEAGIEAAGLTPIQGELQRVDAIIDRATLIDAISHLHALGIGTLFRVGGTTDFKNSKMIIASLGPGSVGLPDRDYYLTERFEKTRGQYVDHVVKMLTLAGTPEADARSQAERILALETKISQATLPRVEARNPDNVYHITKVTDLASMAPNIDWAGYLSEAGVNVATLNVTQPNYVRAVNQLIADTPIADWKAYLRWQILDTAASALPRAFADEDFAFNQGVLSGTKEQQDRWKRCVRATDANLGQLLGQEYVKRNFTPDAKAKMNSLIDNLISALREDIPTLTWMGPETKSAALKKLDAFRRRIGYPDKWIDYSNVTITRDSYLQNLLATRRFSRTRNIGRIGKPDDPDEWGFFTPPTVNASYSSAQNNITFPAGILQPPFYDPNADDAYNYGGIGTVIGHEMTHGFDDQGSKFDNEGNLRNWWTEADLANFKSKAQCIVNQYGEFNVAQGLNIKGDLVQGEAIADLGGATLALRAYEKSLAGKPRLNIDGFTPEQRFFLGFAQVWGENMAEAEQTRRALSDPHAQGPFRVNGTVSNMPEFHKAFRCATGAKMVRDEAKRCAIW